MVSATVSDRQEPMVSAGQPLFDVCDDLPMYGSGYKSVFRPCHCDKFS